jgi:colanic acid/amylovoran biosynthesis glycosyltransferase
VKVSPFISADTAPSQPETNVALATGGQADLPGVLIYTPHLLSTVQHYVREHAVRLRRYRPVLAGRRRVEGTPVDDFPAFTFETGAAARLRELHFLLTGNDSALTAFVRRHRIELIHAHFGTGATEVMVVAARLGIPLVVTFHGWDLKSDAELNAHMSPYERLYRKRLPRLLRQSSEIICVSQNWRDRVLLLGCPAEKVHTNYLGVDSTFFDGVRGHFDPKSIIFVGRLVRRKGVHVLLESMRLLRDQGVDAHLTVVGEGPESDRLVRTVAEHNLTVRFLGKKNPVEIRELLRETAVLCAPSTAARGEMSEALGLVLLEAQAMGVPVVGTRNGGIPETLEDGSTGYLVDEESPAALAAALAKLLNNEDLNKSFGRRARAFVCDRFDIDRCYGALEKLYDEIKERGRLSRTQDVAIGKRAKSPSTI